ncbi:MAG: DUF1566 domain-containing protein [Leptospira sp.]|nr:DUF1566 domain-containing protein [Leptospira sp.]NCS95315.1 DUF1566 domain-containing protein [Leptospira sp.]
MGKNYKKDFILFFLYAQIFFSISSCGFPQINKDFQEFTFLLEIFKDRNVDTSGNQADTALPTFSVTYNGNGNDSGTAPIDSNLYNQSQTVTVLGNTGSLALSGATFAEWNTASDGSGTGYYPGDTFAIAAANIILYARYLEWNKLFPLFDLAQVNCFDNDSTETCPVPGFPLQDPEFSHARTIAQSFVDNGDETITDNRTGLLWRKCPLSTSGPTCGSGITDNYVFADAQTICSATFGAGWRIPTIREYATLISYPSTLLPYTNSTFFPSLGGGSFYSSINDGSAYHFITFSQPSIGSNTLYTSPRKAICVSGTNQPESLSFTDLGDGRVRDNHTNLEWQKCHSGRNNDATCSDEASADTINWQNALLYCDALTWAGFSDWRLPNQNELLSLVDFSIAGTVKFDTTLFNSSSPVNDRMWSSNVSRITGVANPLWINAGFGILNPGNATTGFYVARCVRGPL